MKIISRRSAEQANIIVAGLVFISLFLVPTTILFWLFVIIYTGTREPSILKMGNTLILITVIPLFLLALIWLRDALFARHKRMLKRGILKSGERKP